MNRDADEPINLTAIAADDALVEALASNNPDAVQAVADPDDVLLPPLLGAFVADIRRGLDVEAGPAVLAADARPERVRVVLTPPEAWPPRIHPAYRAWLDGPVPTPGVDPFVARCVVMACFLLCALIAVTWWALP